MLMFGLIFNIIIFKFSSKGLLVPENKITVGCAVKIEKERVSPVNCWSD